MLSISSLLASRGPSPGLPAGSCTRFRGFLQAELGMQPVFEPAEEVTVHKAAWLLLVFSSVVLPYVIIPVVISSALVRTGTTCSWLLPKKSLSPETPASTSNWRKMPVLANPLPCDQPTATGRAFDRSWLWLALPEEPLHLS